jgi:hypothetical protein
VFEHFSHEENKASPIKTTKESGDGALQIPKKGSDNNLSSHSKMGT